MRERFVRYCGGMASEQEIEHSFPSTTFAWRKVKMKTPPAGHNGARAKRGRWRHLARWPRTQHLTLKVSYRGGAESWWLVEARGSQGVFPGCAALEDVMAQVFNEPAFVGPQKASPPAACLYCGDAHRDGPCRVVATETM